MADKFEAAAIARRPVSDLELAAARSLRKQVRKAILPTVAAKVRAILDTGKTMRSVDYAAHTLVREFLRLHDTAPKQRRVRTAGETTYIG